MMIEPAVVCAAIAGGWWAQKWAGWCWLAGNAGWIRRRRRHLQTQRTISDRDLAGLFSSRLDPTNIDIPEIVSLLNPVVALYWSAVRRLL